VYTPGFLRAVLGGNGARTGESELMIRLHPNAVDRPGAVHPHGTAEPTDGELLGRFAKVRDRAALELLVRRHGPMVLGVCRRLLGPGPDADDAFQATFLVLVRKGATLRRPGLVANWLYGVALRVARKARALGRRRRDREEPMIDLPARAADLADHELRYVLDIELDRLPEKYRAPIVLCHLEGHTLDEAARMLGWPKGTVAGRLSRGRDQLRGRLARRGVAVAAPSLEQTLASRAPAVLLPEPLVHAAVRSALDGTAPAAVAFLADAFMREAVRRSLSLVVLGLTAVLLTLGSGAMVAAGVGMWNAPPCCHMDVRK
jgi:RNA polymerase sigma factor (sigma-70 family)